MPCVYRTARPPAIPRRELPSRTHKANLVAMTDTELADRFVGLWNDPDPESRRATIRELWTEDGGQVLQPPQEMRDIAAGIGFPPPRLAIRGHKGLERRVTRAYEDFVAGGGFVFRGRGNVERLDDILKFNWEMVPAQGGEAQAVGLEVFLLDPDGRISTNYQFIEP
jgi:hypothetical protein